MTNSAVPTLTVAIVSRHHLLLLGLQKMFESKRTEHLRVVVHQHQRMTPAVILPENRPDVIILDMETERDTLGTIRHLREAAPLSKIMLLSGFEDKESTREAVDYGVDAVILKIQPPTVVLAAIEALLPVGPHANPVEGDVGKFATPTSVVGNTASTKPGPAVWPAELTQREREVIRLVGQGLSNKDIANQMSISDNTVRHHLTSIFDKVGVPNRQKLLVHAHHIRSTQV
ncbi:MAG: response regulator transcription factor [Nitrospira sp.]|nr:response regulator transcription factor [Nitrospira sp.]